MTDNEIRIAMATVCGWKRSTNYDYSFYGIVKCGEQAVERAECYEKDELLVRLQGLPDYPNDLNAMHEAEKVFDGMDYRFKNTYTSELESVLDRALLGEDPNCIPDNYGYEVIHATARQRAEAFLRTIGKWKE